MKAFRLKKSFELAEKAGAQFIVIVGENEVKADQFAVKNLASGEQVQSREQNSPNSCENRHSGNWHLALGIWHPALSSPANVSWLMA